ncbi:50S ribosomal protein L13 [Candidatus Amesbacteria bacterium RIFOXYB1_FULL_44_23]|uniref:Large ribosomal subunit protein uL13 n=1 Tax=Candidatus Amesbacteria bacterium RIFOXYB1_FULL_44_23 TaxID=1797263 RepID=A0A1F4ZV54_9BACT|nr:MAG: 50S ribosomal protein L13 [Candidatus Amesbacteria bacterium RIFOXYB1_FULL_44_23]
MNTLSPSVNEISRKWHFFDAKDQILGRLSTQIAKILMGKHKTDFVRYFDIADHVVVTNAAKVAVTGNKSDQKVYRHHSGYPGGMKVTSYVNMLEAHPERIITKAVSGMLPDNKLKSKLLRHLHVYPGSDHPFTKQFKQD